MYTYTVIKLRVNQVTHESKFHHDIIKRPKLKEDQLGILKIHAFCWKIQQRALGPEQSTAGVMYLSLRIHSKRDCIFPKKVARTFLSDSRKSWIILDTQLRPSLRLYANTSSPDVYLRK